jgi:hypothetical protein
VNRWNQIYRHFFLAKYYHNLYHLNNHNLHPHCHNQLHFHFAIVHHPIHILPLHNTISITIVSLCDVEVIFNHLNLITLNLCPTIIHFLKHSNIDIYLRKTIARSHFTLDFDNFSIHLIATIYGDRDNLTNLFHLLLVPTFSLEIKS